MKRYGNLWDKITAFDNLLAAARQAEKGKRYRDNVLKFNDKLETNLIELQQELVEKTYQPGRYRTFYVMEPKRRQISAAPYRDRVVHHALCNIIVPILERTFTQSCFANRHRGRRRLRRLTREYHEGRICQHTFENSLQSWLAHLDHGDTWHLQQKIFTDLGIARPCRGDRHLRLLRGGSWNNNPRNCRCANRNRNTPDNRNNNIGFRVYCSVALTLNLPELRDGNPSGVLPRVQTCSCDSGDSLQKSPGSG